LRLADAFHKIQLPEVFMSGRRSHPRFAVATPWDGAVRVLREVVIQRSGDDELVAIGHLPAVVGEEMTLDVLSAGSTLEVRVRVLDSRPVIVDGSVRHRVRLAVVPAEHDVKDGRVEHVSVASEPRVSPGAAAAAEAF
jgi:hypothetical protein